MATLGSLGVLWLLAHFTRREIFAMAMVIGAALLYYAVRARTDLATVSTGVPE